MARKPKLGDRVQDEVTGVIGIMTGKSMFLYGCERFSIQAPVKADGTIPESHWCDAPQVKVVKTKAAKTGGRDTGGPMPSIPTRNMSG